MSDLSAQFVGVELYFEDLERAKMFYLDTLGLHLSDEQPGHHAKFAADAAFVCLEPKVRSPIPPAIRPCFSSRCPISKGQSMPSDRIASCARNPVGRSFTIRKDTTSCSFKPVQGDRLPRAFLSVLGADVILA